MEFLEDVFVPIAKLESQKNQNKIGKSMEKYWKKSRFVLQKTRKKTLTNIIFGGNWAQ